MIEKLNFMITYISKMALIVRYKKEWEEIEALVERKSPFLDTFFKHYVSDGLTFIVDMFSHTPSKYIIIFSNAMVCSFTGHFMIDDKLGLKPQLTSILPGHVNNLRPDILVKAGVEYKKALLPGNIDKAIADDITLDNYIVNNVEKIVAKKDAEIAALLTTIEQTNSARETTVQLNECIKQLKHDAEETKKLLVANETTILNWARATNVINTKLAVANEKISVQDEQLNKVREIIKNCK